MVRTLKYLINLTSDSDFRRRVRVVVQSITLLTIMNLSVMSLADATSGNEFVGGCHYALTPSGEKIQKALEFINNLQLTTVNDRMALQSKPQNELLTPSALREILHLLKSLQHKADQMLQAERPRDSLDWEVRGSALRFNSVARDLEARVETLLAKKLNTSGLYRQQLQLGQSAWSQGSPLDQQLSAGLKSLNADDPALIADLKDLNRDYKLLIESLLRDYRVAETFVPADRNPMQTFKWGPDTKFLRGAWNRWRYGHPFNSKTIKSSFTFFARPGGARIYRGTEQLTSSLMEINGDYIGRSALLILKNRNIFYGFEKTLSSPESDVTLQMIPGRILEIENLGPYQSEMKIFDYREQRIKSILISSIETRVGDYMMSHGDFMATDTNNYVLKVYEPFQNQWNPLVDYGSKFHTIRLIRLEKVGARVKVKVSEAARAQIIGGSIDLIKVRLKNGEQKEIPVSMDLLSKDLTELDENLENYLLTEYIVID